MHPMKRLTCACLACLAMAAPASPSHAASSEAPREGSIPLTQLIAAVAKKTGRKFAVDPRVSGDVSIVGQDPTTIGYADFLTVLQLQGFAAIDGSGYTRIVPDANARQMPTPLLSGKETHADAEYVSRIIPVKSLPAGTLVPILRPLLPQQAHMVAVICTNVLMIVDTFANVKRIEALVQHLDTGEAYKPEACTARAPT
jgi:general secretion pathway protein D